MSEIQLSYLLEDIFSENEPPIWEPALLTSGLSPLLDPKEALSYLEKGLNSNQIKIKSAAVAGLGYFNTPKSKKGSKKAYEFLKSCISENRENISLLSAMSLGKLGFFSHSTKFQKNIYKETLRLTKEREPALIQGNAVGLGLLSKLFPEKEAIDLLIKNIAELKYTDDPGYFIVGLTLFGIASGLIKEAIGAIKRLLGWITNKAAKRTVAICLAFLISLLEPEDRMSQLEFLIRNQIEYQSRVGPNSAIILSYIRMLQQNQDVSNFLDKMREWKDLANDYLQIFEILNHNSDIQELLRGLLESSNLDVRIAGINASFFLERGLGDDRIIQRFSQNCLNLAGTGPSTMDKLLAILRIFSIALMRKDYALADEIKRFMEFPDSMIKKFTAISYSVLCSLKGDSELIISQFQALRDHDIRWGLLVGLGMKDWIASPPSPNLTQFHGLRDELLIGLILLDIGFTDISIPLLMSAISLS
ncbi:MAG: hypothetical protein ACFFCQ_13365 [Promethearchaeota archaeon]